MAKKLWIVAPSKNKPSAIPASVKVSLTDQAKILINIVLAPMHVKPLPTTNDFNYIAKLHAKWHGNIFLRYLQVPQS